MPSTRLNIWPQALRSVRGLLLGVNHRGVPVERTTLRQWIHLSADKFKTQKVDLYLPQAEANTVVPLLEVAARLQLRLSLRCTDATSPSILPTLAEAKLLDVALQPGTLDVETLQPWFHATTQASLPLRLFLDAAQIPPAPDVTLIDLVAGAASIGIRLRDDIDRHCMARRLPNETIDHLIAFSEALKARGTEVHIHDIPFCWVPDTLWSTIVQSKQYDAHHQYYRPSSLEFARKVFRLSPTRIHQAVELSLGEGTSFHNRIDDAVLPWILERPWYFFWFWFLHKLTRRLHLRRPKPYALPEELDELEAALTRHEEKQRKNLGPTCAQCALHPICDHHSETFKQAFPQLGVKAIERSATRDPMTYFEPQTTWYDGVDAKRSAVGAALKQRLAAAHRQLALETPTREIPAESYEIQDHKTHRMPASVRWFSFSTAELRSTVLARLSPPFTLSLTVGGGIAQLMGFALGRHTRILCPMTQYDHKLTLHVDAEGYYVLLRDNEHVHPVAFDDGDQIPERIGSIAEPRISLVNIDGQIVTQTVLVWEGEPVADRAEPCTHSVIVVCTKYARRLQAALMALANQQGTDMASLEVIVGYVPGIDATDDVLDSISDRYPQLRIIRMPLSPQYTRAKGFIINECFDIARGAWITLLDADIMLPPEYFARLDAQPEAHTFVVPDGRHMLSRRATTDVLLGLKRSWECYPELLATAGEYRHRESDGVPPGFCQSVRRRAFEAIRYQELDHFEGSDWWFSAQLIEKFGKEIRLDDLRVLHLDHGGSQWYGTKKQF